MLADLIDVRDIGMIERRGRYCLVYEAPHSICIRREIRRKNLQRDFPTQLRILGQVHLAHPAGTEQGGDPVVFERAVDHKGRNYSNAHGPS